MNVLGEAVLGEREADDRLSRVLAVVRRNDVNYVSVKLSAIVSQLQTIDHDGFTRTSGDQAARSLPGGQAHGTFINLDMEEYRDLRLTLDAFMRVLDEPEFSECARGHRAPGLPPRLARGPRRAHHLLQAPPPRGRRHREGPSREGCEPRDGARGSRAPRWLAAPYASKADVDASYLRLLDVALRAEHARVPARGRREPQSLSRRWALEVANRAGSSTTAGRRDARRHGERRGLALTKSGQPVLLYAPVTRRDDFASAVAYLVRRLDENTSPENYLRAALFIANDEHVYREQEQRFLRALDARHTISVEPRRHRLASSSTHFDNESDGDPTSDPYVREVADGDRARAGQGR